MSVELTVEEVGLMIKKYVDERTAVTAFYSHPQLKVKISGHVDCLTQSGLVVRTPTDDLLELDITGAFQFEMGDKRDVPPEVLELSKRYPSSLCFRLPTGAIVALFENAPEDKRN